MEGARAHDARPPEMLLICIVVGFGLLVYWAYGPPMSASMKAAFIGIAIIVGISGIYVALGGKPRQPADYENY
jgi:hypothetical protein